MNFINRVEQIEKTIIEWRRDFHRYPELGFKEFRSANIISKNLADWGYDINTGIAETGVAGLLEGSQPGKNILVRLDMDALPIQEENRVDYASKNPGVMHACGHDGHMAIGLASAFILAEQKHKLHGSVKFVFQPAEEGLGGAKRMIQEGILKNPEPDVILGLHLINELPAGKIVVCDGAIATSHDSINCIIQGRGGHGAIPHISVDPIVAAAQIIMGLQTVVSRNISPLNTGVVSITSVLADGASNIIPDKVLLKGTIRAFEMQTRNKLHERIKDIIEHFAAGMQCKVDLRIEEVNPALINDLEVANIVRNAAVLAVGEENVRTDYRSTGSDDVAYFTEKVPGCVFHIGSNNSEKGLDFPGHHPKYDFDESALIYGASVLINAITSYVIKC